MREKYSRFKVHPDKLPQWVSALVSALANDLRALPLPEGEVKELVRALDETIAEGGGKLAEDCRKALLSQEATIERQAASLATARDHAAEVQLLAFGWMRAHDDLKAGKPVKLPKPADLPDAIARAEAAEASLASARRDALEEAAVEVMKSFPGEYAAPFFARRIRSLSSPRQEATG